MNDLYRGYIATNGKQAIYSFQKDSDLITLEEAKVLPEYAGVLAYDTVLVDVDDEEQGEILFRIVQAKALKCKVIKTTKGYHFLFHTEATVMNRTNIKTAIGIHCDYKGGGRCSYEVLKVGGVEREVLYDTGEYEILPKYLTEIKTSMDILGLAEGDGRNTALFSYILPLQQNGFDKDECRECIEIINEFVLKDPLPEKELASILRDGAFEAPIFFGAKGNFLFDRFAQYFVRSNNIVKIGGQLHIFRDGIYVPGDENLEAAMIAHIPALSQSRRKEVLSYLDLIVKGESGLADANLIAFKNGVLNIATMEFTDFSPEYIITNKVPHNYNPDATNDLLDSTMIKLACNDEEVESLLYESVGYCLYRRNELRKSFFLLGEKRNGKSTFLDMVQTLLGEDNVANLDLCEIGDRFRTAELTGKLANIGDDIADEWLSSTAVFKKVVSGDVITVERKGQDPYKLRSFAKFFFSANALPRLGRGKDSAAVLDRLVIIPFDATFSKKDPDYDPFIKYKLREEPVIEALIAKAIPALREVLGEQQFTKCSRIDKNLEEYEVANDPILDFFADLDEEDYLNEPIKVVYQKYCTWCLSNNLQSLSALEFQKRMRRRYGLVVTNAEIDKKRVRIYAYEQSQ